MEFSLFGKNFVIACQFTGFLSAGVKRFVYVSAADFGLVNYLLQGYYEGKVISWDYWHAMHIVKLIFALSVPKKQVI